MSLITSIALLHEVSHLNFHLEFLHSMSCLPPAEQNQETIKAYICTCNIQFNCTLHALFCSYYATYYADYFSEYYAKYYVSAVEAVDEVQHTIASELGDEKKK